MEIWKNRTKSEQQILDAIALHGEFHGYFTARYGCRLMNAARKLEERGEAQIIDSRWLTSGEKVYRVVPA